MRTMRRTFTQYLLSLLLIPVCLYTANAQCPASTPLVINSITPAESRCAASGSATVSATGGSAPYIYSITTGPVTAPAQSSNVLQSLAPGTYTIEVTDNCNTSVTGTVTIAGTYTIPSPTLTAESPSCPGSTDGSITVNVAGGRSPLTYSLISPSPVTAAAQTSNVFTGLPAGTYTCQVADSCGNFQTRTVTVAAGSAGSISLGGSLKYIACDSFSFNYVFSADYKPPFTVSINFPDGTVTTQVLTSPTVNNRVISGASIFRYHHATGNGDPITLTVTNNCGASQSQTFGMSSFLDMSVTANSAGGCDAAYTYTLDNSNATQLHCTPITYTLISPAGAVLATQTNNSTFGGYLAGTGYKVIRQTCCGSDTISFDWSPPTSPSAPIFGTFLEPYYTCKEGTTAITPYFIFVNTAWTFTLVSGPPSVTFADGTVFNYTYPYIVNEPAPNTGNVPAVTDIGPGTYKLMATDACGNSDSTTITINPSEVRHDSFSATAEPGCPGDSKILVHATSNASPGFSLGLAEINYNSSTLGYAENFPYSASITGLYAGTYDVTYSYRLPAASYLYVYPNTSPAGLSSIPCDVLSDTVVVPPYVQPAFAAAPAVANCGSVRNVALLPDSASGISPYEFQITAGSTTTAAQSSPVFTGLTAGTYTFEMSDACDNSYSRSVTIDTLALPTIITSGGTCAGDAATFTLPASPFYNYSWQHPDGTVTSGDSLSISPVAAADTGNYTVTVTSTVGGCTSTSSKAVYMGFCTVLDETALNFNGQRINTTIRLSWQSADNPGIRYYTVERSEDGMSFEPIQELAASSATAATYSATDAHPPIGTVFYRLQLTDKSGAITYSQTLSFSKVNAQATNVFPRLITGNTPVIVTYPEATGGGGIRVIGVDGTIDLVYAVPAGSTQTTIDIARLARGAYFVTYSGNGTQTAIEVWKE